ncbi:MAG: hypothetical protein ACD_48C00129G0004 [uncultured bacterium]|nr:MAG: hypothetical protein ACD_48C00129G0004 [uncultured bacterium]
MRRKRRTTDKHHAAAWKYKNLTIAFLGLCVACVLSQNKEFHAILAHLGNVGYIGAFIAGILFVSTFTVATGMIILFIFAETLHPIEIGLIAGLGAVVGDIIIFHLVKDSLANELTDIYNHVDHKKHIKKLLHSKYFSWTLPVIGAIIIASPLPDELGVSLMGLSKMKTVPFLLLSFFLNSIGIFLIVSASLVIKP